MRARAAAVTLAVLTGLLVPATQAGADNACNGRTPTIHGVDDDGDPDTPVTIDGNSTADVIVGTPGNDIIYAGGGDDHVCAGGGADVVYGGDGADQLFGDAGDDELYGEAGNDLVDGLAGSNTLAGGAGTDTVEYWYVSATDQGLGVDLDLALGTAKTAHGTDSLSSVENAYGTVFDDALRGDAQSNYLDGDPGHDIVYGRGGNDHVIGDRAVVDNDENTVDAGNDVLDGGPGHDHLWGHGGNDVMTDPSGTNRFAGDAGNDTMTGGTGFDYVDYVCLGFSAFCASGATTGQLVDLREGTAVPTTGANDGNSANDHGADTFTNIEGARGTKFSDRLLGRDNVAGAGEFGDYFWPGLGNDRVHGRAGPDYVDYSPATSDVLSGCSDQEGLALTLVPNADTQPEVTGYQGNDHLDAIEHAIGSPRSDVMTGTSGANQLWGGCGGDVVRGAGGSDILAGDEGHDQLHGDGGDDRLDGGAGDDALSGGGGDADLVSYDALVSGGGIGVQVHLAAGTALGDGEDAISTTEVIVGSDYDDVLVGGPLRDILIGGAGGDELWGREDADVLLGNGLPGRLDGGGAADGVDRMFGGPGADTADYSKAGAGVVVDLAAQTGAEGATDFVSGMEAVQGSPFADTLLGDAVANRLFGGAGADVLKGRGGDDYLDGESGRDTYVGGVGLGDAVDFGYGANQGVAVDLGAGTAAVTEPGGAIRNETLSGVEVIAGTEGADTLDGGSGRDFLAGQAGTDALRGFAGDDELFGGTGSDTFGGGEHAVADACFTEGGESLTGCESTEAATPDWYAAIDGVHTFRETGDDGFLASLEAIIEELRRLHRRRLHR